MPPKVVFVGGSGRSGTTLLDRMLGQVDGHFSAGEVRHIWTRAYGENQLCGCGKAFHECPIWSAAFREAFGSQEAAVVERAKALRRELDGMGLPNLLRYPRGARASQRRAVEEYSGILGQLFAAVGKVSGATTIVDSSKHASHGLALASMPGADVHVIHLVRDARAVAYSWSRKKHRPEIHWKQEDMPQMGALRSTLGWAAENLKVEGLERVVGPSRYHRILYEELIARPRQVLGGLLRRIGHSDELPFLKDSTITLDAHHTVSGNPMRFKVGPVVLKPDEEWMSAMPARDKHVASASGALLLRRYGYSLRRARGGN